jgi:hypothetical protein
MRILLVQSIESTSKGESEWNQEEDRERTLSNVGTSVRELGGKS